MTDHVRSHNRIKDEKGSTMITVIVAISFVTILTTIILGTTLVNVRMKGIDRRTKDDFYYAEKALNDIYTGLGQILAIQAGTQYDKSFKRVGEYIDAENDYNLAETARRDFRTEFMKYAHDLIPSGNARIPYLQGFITSRGTVDKVGDIIYEKKDGTETSEAKYADRVIIKDVQISDTDTTNYKAVITTDIVIDVPTLDFLGGNTDVSDYGLIAGKGLYINGSATINGNVYAGVFKSADASYPSDTDPDHPFFEKTDKYARDKVFGGININDCSAKFSSNYIVSKGDINLAGKNSKIEVIPPAGEAGSGNLTNLWYTSLRTITTPASEPPSTLGPVVKLNANVFALNDLTLNANNSNVEVKGNYYGYNDGTKKTIGVDKDKREDGASSAIIVNGSHATLDMRNIENFVLMGKAYIDFTSGDDTNAAATAKQVVPTAESVALKTNQQLYLVPPDFLTGPNPAEGTGITFTVDATTIKSGTKEWFALKYLDVGPNPSSPDFTKIHEKYTVELNDSKTAYYDYLKFNEKTWTPNGDGTYTDAGDPLGTHGAVSSKTKFFYDIMNWKKDYERAYNADPAKSTYAGLDDYINKKEEEAIQPSAKRLYERINLSMGFEYFDLQKCVIGDTAHAADAHYYAKNAVINYEKIPAGFQSNVLDNTHGMGRYLGYSQNLFNRYVWLCTKLDGREEYELDEDPLDPGDTEWVSDYADSAHAAPLCHFIHFGNLNSSGCASISAIETAIADAAAEGLKPGAYGAVIISKSSLNLANVPSAFTADTFKGVAIVDGDITVPYGKDVNGLLMATGTITLLGDNNIYYDKGLIQARIEKEINLVKNSPEANKENAYKSYYLINYLGKEDAGGVVKRMYDVDPGIKRRSNLMEADYNEFVHYENWQKGEK